MDVTQKKGQGWFHLTPGHIIDFQYLEENVE